MSLRRKTVLAIGIILISLLVGAYLIQHLILSDSFVQLEEREMRAHITRAQNALQLETMQLASIAADWARWDDTYEFIEDANDAYVKSNLTDAALANLRLNVMVFVHSSGRIVASKAYDLQHQRAQSLPASLSAHLTRESILLDQSDPMRITSGILVLPEGPLLVAALPILTSQDTGPSRGTLIFGRFLDDETITRLGDTIQLSLVARRWDAPALPADFQTARAFLASAAPTHTQPLDDQILAGYALLDDVYARPAVILRATMPREITQQGRISQIPLAALATFCGIVAYIVALWGLDRMILARLARLARQVHQIGEQGTVSQRVQISGNDELGALEHEINRMLAAIPVSEERFRALIEHSHDLILVLNRDTTIHYASPTLDTMLGYTPDEVRGRSALEFVHPDDRDAARQAFAHRLTRPGAAEETMRVRARHRDGDYRNIELLGSNLLDNPAVAGIVINGHDITARQRAERELRKSEERWRMYLDQASDLIFALDADGRVTLANRALCDALGYAAEEILGKSPLEFLAPEARADVAAALQRILCGENIDHMEVVALTRAQKRITLDVRGRTFREGDQIIGTLHIARDITTRKQTEELLRQQEKLYRSLIENSSDLILLVNEHRMIRYISPSVERMLGYSPTDVIGADLFEFTHPDEQALLEEVFQRTLDNPYVSHRVEHRLRHQDGTWHECETIAQAYQREYGVDIAISTRDITERKRANAALDAERHLLRTMIDAIPDVIFVKDTAGRFLLNNAYHLRTLGVTRQAETLGKTVFDFHPDDLAQEYFADDQRIVETGEPLIEKEQIYLNSITGERRWHLMTKVPLRDANGQITGIVGVGRDITERKKMEDELRRSQKEWHDIFNAIGHPTFILDLRHGVIAANPAVVKQLGKPPEQIIGKKCHQLFHDSDTWAPACPMETLLHSGKTEPVEMEMQTVSGTFLVSCTPVLDARGNVEKVIHIATDITALKEAQRALQESNARFYALVEGIPDIVYLKDLEGRNLYVNKAYEDFAGTTRANIIGKCDDEIMPPSLATECSASDQQVFQTGVTTRSEECTHDRDNNLICYETIKSPIRDATGRVIGLVGVSRDITERKRAAQALAESEQRFRTLIEDAPIAISIGRNGTLIYANPAYVQMYGFTDARELIGQSVLERLAPECREESFERSQRRARGAAVETQYELIGLRQDGSTFPMLATVTRVQLADGPANIGFFQDITERKRAETELKQYSEQLQQMVEARTRELRNAQEQLVRQERLATLGQLAGSVAHELRSPLGAIKNAAYYLKMCLENPSPDTAEMMRILDEQVDVSARIIGSLLDFARPKTPTLQRVHLPYVVQAAAQQCEFPANVTLAWQMPPQLPTLLLDAAQMQVVFRNLIANALQAMLDGGTLTISARQISDFRLQIADSSRAPQSEICNLKSAIEIRVADTGVGIAPDALDKIFQPLYTTKAKGIGLGLALCKMIVEAHGGTIGATSEVGKGTTFTVTLPVE